ncbi:MAG: hypothetical protein NTZ05_14900, partial [Chloroflexi bacterium]|nr:hypothetical protein [Chloroflexota bacterium]
TKVTPPQGAIVLGGVTIEVTVSPPVALGERVTVRFRLTPEQIQAARDASGLQNVVVGRIEADGTITPLPTTIDLITGVVTAITDHFTKFSLLVAKTPGPLLTGPASGAALAGLGATLAWTNPVGTTQYQIQVIPFNQDGPGFNLIRNVESSYTIKAPDFGGRDPNYIMLPDITYVWRVRTATVATSAKEGDWSAWSLGSFRTARVVSGTISLVSPAERGKVTSLTPILTWSNTNKAVFYYEIQVSQDTSFTTDPATATAAVYWNLVHGGVPAPGRSHLLLAGPPAGAGRRQSASLAVLQQLYHTVGTVERSLSRRCEAHVIWRAPLPCKRWRQREVRMVLNVIERLGHCSGAWRSLR